VQDVEDVGEQRGVRGLVPRQGLEQLPGACHHERQDQPVWLRQGQRPFGGLRGERALAGPRGDQHGEVDRRAADGRHPGEAHQAGQERHPAAQQVRQPAPSNRRLPNARV
jgi:hypothetical protein